MYVDMSAHYVEAAAVCLGRSFLSWVNGNQLDNRRSFGVARAHYSFVNNKIPMVKCHAKR